MLVNAQAIPALLFRFDGNRFLFRYSTAREATPKGHFIVKYLINSLGFSKKQAIASSAKVTCINSLMKPDLAVDFLKQTGFKDTDIKILVSKFPDMLFHDVEKTLKPKLQCLSELGLSGSDLVKVLLRDWPFVSKGLDTHIKPLINCLRNVLCSHENVVKVIKRGPWLIALGGCERLEENLNLLRSFGCSNDKIKNIVLKNPNYLLHNTKKLEEMLHMVEKELGISHDSVTFHQVVHVLTCLNQSNIDTKFGIFKSFGWSDSDIYTLLQKLPYCIGLSEARIQTALTFLMKQLRYESFYIASHPSLLSYSLEKRVIPRYEIWKLVNQKKLTKSKWCFYTLLTWPESKFLDKYLLPLKAELPDLYDLYIKCIGK